ncbi:bacillithiol system redox-active protein YtxJ [Flavobacterium sp.]|uniref:bacillithiol system redox-active protein YtxJ n=1 Tax=Flavobacterium sp. TaxID=239 RepID=UPI0028BF1108|nr:bacillithiol system redox-active protein YtxJ [Flavobacterium sp.]
MGFFNKIFGVNKSEDTTPESFWMYLEETPLDEIVKISFEKPVAIFKHSTRCSVSRMAWNQFSNQFDIEFEKMGLYFLDLLAYRSISNEVAERFGVVHQSPQLIVIKEGKAIFDTSHSDIDAEDLKQFI